MTAVEKKTIITSNYRVKNMRNNIQQNYLERQRTRAAVWQTEVFCLGRHQDAELSSLTPTIGSRL